jgi:Tol biopolymer transport system component
MSPEQVRGKPADARSDIFAFGAILYEMLSGKRAFHGDSAADTMSAILKEDPPDLSVTNQNVSPALDRIVRHSLEKNPDLRFQSARDLAFNLEALSATSTPSGMGAAIPTRRRFPWLVLAGAAAVLAAFAVGRLSKKESPSSQPTWERVTFRRGNLGAIRFAPDGKSAIYGASWEGKPIEIYTSRLGSPESTPLGYRNANLLGVSSAGELALSLRESYLSGVTGVGTLARAPLGGGVPRPILEFVEWADWTPDGKDLAVVRFVGGRNRLEFPIGKVLYDGERAIFSPRFSPRGDRIAFIERPGLLRVVDLSGKATTLADGIRGITVAWSPSGDEILADTRSGTGEGRIIGTDLSGKSRVVLRCPDRLFLYDVSPDGRALVERAASRRRAVGLAPGASTEREISWFDGSDPIGLSADGQSALIAETGDAAGVKESFYLRKTDGSPAVKLGEGDSLDLSPDGKWVLVRTDDGRGLALVPTGTGNAVGLPSAGFERIAQAAFFGDGRRVLIFAFGKDAGPSGSFYVQEVSSGQPRKVADGSSFVGKPVSPDGKWIVGLGSDWEKDLILIPVDGGSPRTIPQSNTIDPIRWSPDGRSIFAVEAGSLPARILRVDVATGRREPWKELGPSDLSGVVQINSIVMTPDARAYVYSYSSASTSDLFVVDGLDIRGRKASP